MANPNQPCPGVLQVDMRYVQDGQSVQNIFHVMRAGDTTAWLAEEITGVATAFTDWYTTTLKPLFPSTISLMEVVCTDLINLAGLKQSFPQAQPNVGTNVSPALPNNVTIAIKLAPGTRGRGTSGRIFWPALCESQVAGDQVSSGTLDDIAAAMTDLEDRLAAASAPSNLVVLSRVLNKARRAEGIGKRVENITITDAYIDSQKNRLPMHKRHKKTPTP